MISIKGLDKAVVLLALAFEAKHPPFYPRPDYSDAVRRLKYGSAITEFAGRLLSVDLLGDEVDPTQYDSVNGAGVLDRVVWNLRDFSGRAEREMLAIHGQIPMVEKQIKKQQCKHGWLYRISSRNLGCGVYHAPVSAFVGLSKSRDGSVDLDYEFHFETDPPATNSETPTWAPTNTATPIWAYHEVPPLMEIHERSAELLAYLCGLERVAATAWKLFRS